MKRSGWIVTGAGRQPRASTTFLPSIRPGGNCLPHPNSQKHRTPHMTRAIGFYSMCRGRMTSQSSLSQVVGWPHSKKMSWSLSRVGSRFRFRIQGSEFRVQLAGWRVCADLPIIALPLRGVAALEENVVEFVERRHARLLRHPRHLQGDLAHKKQEPTGVPCS